MLKISKLADYASVAMNFLVRHQGQTFSAAAIAEQVKLPLPTVSKVLKLLNEAELLTSTRGNAGGYQLAHSPETISVAAVITAIEGRPAMTDCCKGEAICGQETFCELRGNWRFINDVIFQVLDNINLLEMQHPLALSNLLRESR